MLLLAAFAFGGSETQRNAQPVLLACNVIVVTYPARVLARILKERGFVMEGKKGQPTTIDEYIAQYPEEMQQILVKIRAVIRESAPGAVEKIGYQMPGFYLNGGLVWFGVHKHHIGFYPTPSVSEAFKEDLSAYKGTKGSLHFPLDKPIPYDLISKIVKFRVAENTKPRGSRT